MKFRTCLILSLLLFTSLTQAAPLGAGFTYQGKLKQTSANANGAYDFEFNIYNVETGGSAIGGTVLLENVAVVDGVFTVELDFGSGPFDGTQLWLAIAVREGASFDPHTNLSPRQKLTAVPYALRADTVTNDAVDDADADPLNEIQNLWATVNSDSGSTSADTPTDTLNVVGSGTVSTAIVGDTLTITGSSSADNLGNHSATQNLDLSTFKLVGNGGSVGLAIANDGDVTFGNTITIDGVTDTITASSGTISFD